MIPFLPESFSTFRFVSHDFDPKRSVARLSYALDDAHLFSEEFEFPPIEGLPGISDADALDRCLRALHLVAGISYYKTAVPARIEVETGLPSEEEADFLDRLYLCGLGEFACRNGLDLRGRIRFPRSPERPDPVPVAKLPRRTAVPLGGGKDSLVTLEALRSAGEPIVLFSLGTYRPVEEAAALAGLPKITVRRRISPLLFELNAAGAYNGHVPISAIIAFALPVAAVLYGFDEAALSNERSANFGNLVHAGMEVNHQYSKSLDFERRAQAHLSACVLPGFRYFSLLRPLSELSIARAFARLETYHDVFTSCNAAFRIDESRRTGRWCRNCPKCRFVFLALAPFLDRNRLIAIFGANLLDDETQMTGYEELLGISGHKPFECVGEASECLAALTLLRRRPEWSHDSLVRRFAREIEPKLANPEGLLEDVFAFSENHMLPARHEETLRAFVRTRK